MATFRGWKNKEREELIAFAKRAIECGEPLARAFSQFAEKHNRKPDSVRNYYYSMLLETEARGEKLDGIKKHKIKMFSEKETENLLSSVLSLCAEGMSVRSAIKKIAPSDKQALRLQNKYRNVLRSNEPLVLRVMNVLKLSGTYYNPYKKIVINIETPERILVSNTEKHSLFEEFSEITEAPLALVSKK